MGAYTVPDELLELQTQIREAERRLALAQRSNVRFLSSAPVLYMLGDANAAKTTTVVHSGLDPELLAGEVFRNDAVLPTSVCNFWYTQQGVLIEAGEAVRKHSHLWCALVRRTRPKLLKAMLGVPTPVRAAVICTSCESFFGSNALESLRILARTQNEMLKELSTQLGVDLPVYVVFTKLDRILGFEEFVRHLTTEEVVAPLGVRLPRHPSTSGVYAEQATATVSTALDKLFFNLREFLLEVLSRESEQHSIAAAYQFPRELQKLRNNITSYLVELARPTHLNSVPYLRGIFFTGVRAYTSRQSVSTPAQANTYHEVLASDATQILSLHNHKVKPAVAEPQMITQKVAQFCFLPRLFQQVLLGDQEALEGTRSSRHVHLIKRIGLAAGALALLIWIAGLTVSFIWNLQLERSIERDAESIQDEPALLSVASTSELRRLDHLRSTISQLREYEHNGVPLSLRWGLYRGDAMLTSALQIYFKKFQRLIFDETQRNLTTKLRSLPPTPLPDADYLTTYNFLKAYLITTSLPDKSTVEFLPPILDIAWLEGAHPAGDDRSELADRQFRFYAQELLINNPYHLLPDSAIVTRARTYLNNFGSFERVYRNILSTANQNNSPIDFNRMFPGSAATVSESHVVPGAFTAKGFIQVMEAANHPERFFVGESWVIGDASSPVLRAAALSQQLHTRYAHDYADEWRTYLRSATVVRYRNLDDASNKLRSLSSPNSALLSLIFIASHNTTVADAQIANQFQSVQALVAPDNSNRLIGAGNTNYIDGLVGLGAAISQFNQTPSATTDPTGTQPVLVAATTAISDVSQTAKGFNIDTENHIEQMVTNLLQEPITYVEGSLRGLGSQQLSAASNGFCSALDALSKKYPFSRGSSMDATREDVASLLKPGTGVLWQFYDASLKSQLTQLGGIWVETSTAHPRISPAFLKLFRRLATLSTILFPDGSNTPTLTFSVRVLPAKGIKSITFALDSQRLTGSDASKTFTWSAQSAKGADLIANYGSGSLPLHFSGTWALFRLIDRGRLEQSGPPNRLAYPLDVANTQVVINGTPLTERLEFSGAGASLLVPNYLNGLHCPSQIGR